MVPAQRCQAEGATVTLLPAANNFDAGLRVRQPGLPDARATPFAGIETVRVIF